MGYFDKIIVVSEEYKNKSKVLKRYYKKIVTIPNGVDIQVFNPYVQFHYIKHLFAEKKLIVLCSLLEKYHAYKGIHIFLSAFSKLRNLSDVIAIIIGEGELRKDLIRQANKLGLEKNVFFLNFLKTQGELAAIFKSANLFVLPSFGPQEGFGLVALEALSTGTPVIVSSAVGIAHEVKKYSLGAVFPERNIEVLTKSLEKLLAIDSKELCVLRKKSWDLVKKKYTWERTARLTSREFEKVVR
jgi:glycosyltransferase involved in cell wall biosynthesis